MTDGRPSRWRRWLPCVISGSTLAYVFGYVTDWPSLIEATRGANLPLYISLTALDKLIFFAWWGVLQASAVRRFVAPVSVREVVAVRGAAELVRTVNGALGDAAFLFGMSRLTRGHLPSMMAAFAVPVACHFCVLLLQANVALFFLKGGVAENRDVFFVVVFGWVVVGGVTLLMRLGLWDRIRTSERYGSWVGNISFRSVLPYAGWFTLFAAFDVAIQGYASRAFGVEIGWWALAARIPILYLFISLPSFGNFGTRELAWAASFSEFGTRDSLIAYAFATNTLFLIFHAMIGALFLPRALRLIAAVRQARREGRLVPEPLLHDASDP